MIDLKKLREYASYGEAVSHKTVLDLLDILEAAQKDAARYRWLRDENTDVALVLDKRTNYTPPSDDGLTGGSWDYEYRCGDELDSAIDAAMQS